MKRSVTKRLADRKREIKRRLQRANELKYRRAQEGAGCVLNSAGLKFELGDKTRAISYGGIPLFYRLAHEAGLVNAIDRRLHL